MNLQTTRKKNGIAGICEKDLGKRENIFFLIMTKQFRKTCISKYIPSPEIKSIVIVNFCSKKSCT